MSDDTTKQSADQHPPRGPDFIIEQCPNPDIVVLHQRQRFPQSVLGPCQDVGIGQLCAWQRRFLKHLRAVRGVETVYANGYQVTITKGKCFTWEEILPAVEKAVTRVCG